MNHIFIFKRRKIDKQILIGWVLLALILPIMWNIFTFLIPETLIPYFNYWNLGQLIDHSSRTSFRDYWNFDQLSVPLIITLITLLLIPIALALIMLLRMSTTVYTIDEEKIVRRDLLFKKEILWSNIANVQYNITTVNGIQNGKTFSIKNLKGKILLELPCPPEKSFIGNGNLIEILLSIFNSQRSQCTADIKKALPDIVIFQLNFFVRIFLHLFLMFLLFVFLKDMQRHQENIFFGIFLLAIVSYLGLINFNSRYEVQKDGLKYKNIFRKEIKIPWETINHVTHNTGIINYIVLETQSGKLILRGISLINGAKLVHDISLRCQIALEENTSVRRVKRY